MDLADNSLDKIIKNRTEYDKNSVKTPQHFFKISNDLVQGAAYNYHGNPSCWIFHADIKP